MVWRVQQHALTSELLPLQVLGNAKGVVAATISVLLFHNPVTAMSMAGYGITVCGVVCYSQARS